MEVTPSPRNLLINSIYARSFDIRFFLPIGFVYNLKYLSLHIGSQWYEILTVWKCHTNRFPGRLCHTIISSINIIESYNRNRYDDARFFFFDWTKK